MNKKKILALCLIVCLLAIAVVGGTLAYFTDTAKATNTFTAGRVEIKLDEAVVEPNDDGNLVAKGSERTHMGNEYHLYPAQVVTKDPTIYNVGNEDAYIAARVTITSGAAGDIEELLYSTDHYMHMLDISKIISGGYAAKNIDFDTEFPLNGYIPGLPVYGTTEFAVYQIPEENGGANGTGEYVLYFFVKNPVAPNGSVMLFDTMTIPAAWDNREMEIMNGTTILVEAFATQTNGFDSCYEAINTAFPAGGENPFINK